MRFVFEYMTQTQLGELFGTTSHKIGSWLKDLGLRNDFGQPTQQAHSGGFCKQAPSGATGFHWVWHSEKAVTFLNDNGYAVLPNPPRSLVHPAILNGPFSVRKSAGPEFVIKNGDGSVSLWANNQMTAEVVAKILNAAHKVGHVARLCQLQRVLQTPLASDKEINNVVTPFNERKEEPPHTETTPHHSHNDTI